jgi:hypothetical protein
MKLGPENSSEVARLTGLSDELDCGNGFEVVFVLRERAT